MKKANNLQELKDFVNSKEVKVVKIGAEWCSPCKTMESVIADIEKDENYADTFINVNVDDIEDDIVSVYDVKAIPLILYYKDGLIVDRTVGAMTKNSLLEIIEKAKRQ